jgi:hypothetical protein
VVRLCALHLRSFEPVFDHREEADLVERAGLFDKASWKASPLAEAESAVGIFRVRPAATVGLQDGAALVRRPPRRGRGEPSGKALTSRGGADDEAAQVGTVSLEAMAVAGDGDVAENLAVPYRYE